MLFTFKHNIINYLHILSWRKALFYLKEERKNWSYVTYFQFYLKLSTIIFYWN